MTRCHACQQELTDAALAAQRCQNCGAPLMSAGQATVDTFTIDPTLTDADQGQTVELSVDDTHGDPPPSEQPKQPEPSDEVQQPDQPPKSPTVVDHGDMTIEFDQPPTAGPTPTLEQGAEQPGAGRGTKPINADFTIDFGGDDPDLTTHMTGEWASAVSEGGDAGQTLRQSGTINEFIAKNTRSSLPIKNRSLRQTTPGSGQILPMTPGDVPDYELLEMIGKGGMGVVYSATQSSIARNVAIKMLKPGTKVGEEARDKFISEAVVTGDLDHPNIVPIYDMGANDEGALFYSMKRVNGTPWEDVLKEKTLEQNLAILMRVADAVAFAHAAGVLHRDLKPENVMLGDFGEVLVMDWGLARVTADFRNAQAIYQSDSLGGTPAYMAPEMARGPVDAIDERSDVYLLGAMLYEIVGGIAPHSGRDVMQCLMAAANNKIDPIDTRGELVDIALRAMETNPDDRYQSVKQFQTAISRYQSHSESLVLTASAEQNLEQAVRQDDYALFARALYGCQEALTLWEGNHKAATLLEQTRLDYADAAHRRGDYELGLSLLPGESVAQREMIARLEGGRQERDARQRRLTLLKRVAAAMVAAFIIVVSYASYAINEQKKVAEGERQRALEQKSIAEQNEQRAKVAEADALTQKEAAEEAAQREAEQKLAEQQARRLAEQREREAEQARRRAKQEEAEAVRQRLLAERAKQAEEYEAYVAQIGLAAAKIDENAFDSARQILSECQPDLRNWEWGRLWYLCGLSPKAFTHGGPVEAVAYSPDGRLIASGDWDGKLILRDAQTGEARASLPIAQYVHALAFSPDGRTLAAGCSDGVVRMVDVRGADVTARLTGHTEGVLSVAFSADASRLITSGYDNTTRIWDTRSGEQLQQMADHTWWVWSAQFSPDASRVVTASQDGKVSVYQRQPTDARYALQTQFVGHEGPVYAAAFSPDGRRVASGGYDNQVLLWSPEDVQAISLEDQLEQRAGDQDVAVELVGHQGPVRSVQFSADGHRLLTCSYDNSVRLWDVAQAQPIKTLRGHGAGVMDCAFSPDGLWAVSGGQDQRVRLWDIAGYEEARVLRGRVISGHADAVLSARFSADGRQIITASRDRSSKLYNAQDGQLIETFSEGHEFLVSSARFFDNGQRLVTAAGDNSARVWDVAAGAELFALRPTGRTAALAVSPDGAWIVTGGEQTEGRVWPAVQGAEPILLNGHEAEVTAAAVSPDSRVVATGDSRGVIRLWTRNADQWIAGQVLRGHSRTITALQFAGPHRLVSASGDNTCGQWDVRTGREDRRRVLKHPDWVTSLDVSGDGQLAITACEDGSMRVWRLADASVVATRQSPDRVYSSVQFSQNGAHALLTSSLRFNPEDTEALLAAASSRTVDRWGWRDSQQVQTVIDLRGSGSQVWAARYAGSDQRVLTVGGNDARLWDLGEQQVVVSFSPHGAVSGAALSPNGRLAATASWDNSIKLWDVQQGRAIKKLEGQHQGYVNSVVFSPASNEQLLSASDDGLALIWSLSKGTAEVRFAGHRGRVRQAVYSHDGRQVLTVGEDKSARLWDAQTGQQERRYEGHTWAVLCGAVSPDGSRIVTGSQDNTARIWDARSGEVLHTLAGHTASVTSVAFSVDGARVLTGGQDRVAKLWDASTGKEIMTLNGHSREVTSVAFSPEGRHALTASRDGTAILWLAEPWGEPVANAAR